MVGGLLVSYRLVGEVRGASFTDCGTTSGCEGSVMKPCTVVSLRALAQLEGDEDLAPQVFAMDDSKKLVGGAHAAWAQMEVLWKGVLAWALFCNKGKFK